MKKLFLLSAVALGYNSFGQSLSNEVIGNSGDFNTTATVNLSWTLGEVMTETYSTAGNLLTQGFHQPYLNQGQNIGYEEVIVDFNVSLFPNPTANLATLIIHDDSESYQIELYDISGKLLIQENSFSNTNYTFDLSTYERGIYMVKIIGLTSGKTTSLKLQKIN